MKKLLLFISAIALLGISSCSKNDVNEISQAEKENLVKHAIIEFNKSAIKTGKYQVLISEIAQKSVTGDLDDLEELLQEFLGDQTQSFLNVYYKILELNLTEDEFFAIANQFEYLRIDTTGASKEDTDGCCTLADSSDNDPIGWLIRVACGCGSDDGVGDQGDNTND
ncbi:hypothetical protein [Aquimarina sp. AU474]|uniref:hypothetical protein n=1 Tax=Aquimarina sp. AU474 TaxID=2108529 RepID=UPI000D68BC44|nr:hypothetical protein [Aquimarina sp. AU474]